jgi:GntR family transcriptional regulator
MIIKIDFNSDEAIYMQITNQIIMGIAKRQICDGDQLPSIRNMADEIGINMHTVNKAYTVLRQAGYVKLDRRRGAVVNVDVDKIEAIEEIRRELSVTLAKAGCMHISKEEIHELVDEIYNKHLSDVQN